MLEEAEATNSSWRSYARPESWGPSPAEAKRRELYCPFESRINPAVRQAQERSVRWVRSVGLLSTEREFAHLEKSKIAWLTARAFHDAPAEALQVAANWTTLFCLLDDRIEQSERSPLQLGGYLARLVQAFRSGVGDAGDPVARALVDLREHMLVLTSHDWVAGFGNQLEEMLSAFPMEAIFRQRQTTPDLDTYRMMRQMTVGLYPHFHFMAMIRGVAVPLAIRRQPLIRRLERATSNAVGWANDIFTYEKEMQEGEVNNLVFALHDAMDLSLEGAVERAIVMHNDQVREFIHLESQLPSFWAWDREVRCYVDMLRSWVRGHLDWGVETGRYRPQIANEDGEGELEDSGLVLVS